jgi:hypothetical protein
MVLNQLLLLLQLLDLLVVEKPLLKNKHHSMLFLTAAGQSKLSSC